MKSSTSRQLTVLAAFAILSFGLPAHAGKGNTSSIPAGTSSEFVMRPSPPSMSIGVVLNHRVSIGVAEAEREKLSARLNDTMMRIPLKERKMRDIGHAWVVSPGQ